MQNTMKRDMQEVKVPLMHASLYVALCWIICFILNRYLSACQQQDWMSSLR